MSFFKKLAASAGIGAAKVDTILEKDAYFPGEEVQGTVHVKGGKIAQDIRYIDLQLSTRYVIVKDDEEHRKYATIHSFRSLVHLPYSLVKSINFRSHSLCL